LLSEKIGIDILDKMGVLFLILGIAWTVNKFWL